MKCSLMMGPWTGIDELPGETEAPGEESDPSLRRRHKGPPHPCRQLPQDGCSQALGSNGPRACLAGIKHSCWAGRQRQQGRWPVPLPLCSVSCLDSRAGASGVVSPQCCPRSCCFPTLTDSRTATSLHCSGPSHAPARWAWPSSAYR